MSKNRSRTPLRNPKIYGVPQKGQEFGKIYQEDTGPAASEINFTLPVDYPPTEGATEVWNWGEAETGGYTSEIQGDEYVEGVSGSANVDYGQDGPSGTNMSAIYWNNNATDKSHHTSPGTTDGQSDGAVNANMKPGTSDFKFYFLMKSINGPNAFYHFFDYDLQEDGTTFNQGIQFFVSTSGIFAPCSLGVTIKDSTDQVAVFHAKTGATQLFEDNTWHFLELIFNRTQLVPYWELNGRRLTVLNTFGGPALSALTTIEPTAGIRFGMKEFGESETGRADIMMAAAAYAKSLTYTWE